VSTVLFVCLHNAGRSQISQALFEQAAGGRHRALSAGTAPGERVNPAVVDATRDEIAARVGQLLAQLDAPARSEAVRAVPTGATPRADER
jgi:protein-tyrosine-phosphatase